MATYTPNLNIKKPLGGEYYDVVAAYNDAMDKLDKQFSPHIIMASGMKLESTGIDNTAYLDALIDAPLDGSIIRIPPGTYIYNGSKTINKRISFISEGAVLKTTLDNHNIFFNFSLVDDIVVSGITFDNNLKGRTCLDFNTVNNVRIANCKFTRYSAAYGHYQTDSAIRLSDVSNAVIEDNIFQNFGDQYDSTEATLNRCITVNDVNCDNIIIRGNTFKNVNQGIANLGSHVLIEHNIFDGVKDNTFYGLGGSNIIINGNYLMNGTDENLVLGGNDIIVTNNHIINSVNKAIAINTDINNLIITGNIFDNSAINYGQFIVYRNLAYIVNNMTIADNQFVNSVDTYSYPYFIFGNILNLNFNNNLLKLAVVSAQKILSFEGISATGRIKDNNFDLSGGDGTALSVSMADSVTTYEMYYITNRLVGGRVGQLVKLITQGQLMQTNVGPYGQGMAPVNILYNALAPTLGTWKRGDIIYNTSPVAGGYLGWVCVVAGDPGTWKEFGLIQA